MPSHCVITITVGFAIKRQNFVVAIGWDYLFHVGFLLVGFIGLTLLHAFRLG
jgi:hypothetical protein